MASNLMEQYIKITSNFIKNFTKMFFAEKYDEEISRQFIETYLEARIYNFGDDTQKFFYRKIYGSLIQKRKELEKEYPKLDESILENNLRIYQFILYMDEVRPILEFDEFVKTICEKRKTKFELNTAIRSLEGRVLKLIKGYQEQKREFFEKYETNEFILEIQKYTLIDNTYKVDINYNFKIPYIYSNKVINEVFNDGIVNEDKLIIEYVLLTLVCIRDVNKCNFSTKYLVNFAKTLYKKQSKLKQTLRVIDNPAIQDKIFLKIEYKDFEENKELIYSLMKEGYRFAVIIDDTFNITPQNLKMLSVFKYMLVPEDCINYDKIKDNEKKINNTIIYDL